MLDVAVVFGVLSGVSTCLAAALAIFALEMPMPGKGLRSKILWAEIASGKTPAAGAPRQ